VRSEPLACTFLSHMSIIVPTLAGEELAIIKASFFCCPGKSIFFKFAINIMSHNDTDMYAASCNPSRRAKRLRSGSTSISAQLPSEALSSPTSSPSSPLPHVGCTTTVESRPYTNNAVAAVVPAPQKRGRKSGLSRAAREAQRKLNHSMIEKARRTKINDALAALRSMVPADYGSQAKVDGEVDVGDKEGDGEEWGAKDRGKPKDKGKKEEKEKEFKLEILVRAVSFMQDLMAKVGDIEAARKNMCPNCRGTSSAGLKRKRSNKDVDLSNHEPNLGEDSPSMREDLKMMVEPRHVLANRDNDDAPLPPHLPCRLPSISSWLHSQGTPNYLLPASSPRPDNTSSYLPSPPSSTHTRPVSTTRLPPKLALGSPIAGPLHTVDTMPNLKNPNSGSSMQPSPEDESAASLLLQISISSPSWSPLPTSASTNAPPLDLTKSTQSLSLGPHQRRPSEASVIRQAQTPSSLLGMRMKT